MTDDNFFTDMEEAPRPASESWEMPYAAKPWYLRMLRREMKHMPWLNLAHSAFTGIAPVVIARLANALDKNGQAYRDSAEVRIGWLKKDIGEERTNAAVQVIKTFRLLACNFRARPNLKPHQI